MASEATKTGLSPLSVHSTGASSKPEDGFLLPPAARPGVAGATSSIKSVDLHSSDGEPEEHVAEGDEPHERFCSLLACLDICLPTSIVDYVDHLCLMVYNCIAPLFRWEPVVLDDNEDKGVQTTINAIHVPTPQGHRIFSTTHGHHYKIHGDFNSDDGWLGMKIQIKDDDQTAEDGTWLCLNVKTGEKMRISWLFYSKTIGVRGSVGSGSTEEKPVKAAPVSSPSDASNSEISVKLIEPAPSLMGYKTITTSDGAKFHVLATSDESWDARWINTKIQLTSDEHTNQNGVWNATNSVTKETARFREAAWATKL